MEATIKTRQDAIERISTIAEPEAMMMVFMRTRLEAAFGRTAVTLNWSPVTHFRVKSPDGGKDILVASVTRGGNPAMVVNRIAIDCETLITDESEQAA